ncbi:hypothetical protein B0H16DRAFT_1589966 [Mycena metata]|uniref:Uncharacterized protein n=1 Tax=Mycena metata TaxID=1033252 RepID=A0AAD7HTI0_9AGAR|nr:hypothetical protein B0H16DRAFT_1589966 [Mycena metata]
MMDPPPPVDFYPTERIQELYMELPTVFAKDIARRASTSSSPLKRERSDDIPTDMMNKRRDTGESKTMMPPPPIPSPVANAASPFGNNVNSNLGGMTNGSGVGTPPGGDPLLGPQNPMMGDPQLSAASRERTRQAQMRAAQQQQAGEPADVAAVEQQFHAGSGGRRVPAWRRRRRRRRQQRDCRPVGCWGHAARDAAACAADVCDSDDAGASVCAVHDEDVAEYTNIQRERQQNGQGGGGGPFPGGQTSPVSPIAPMGGGGGGGGGGGPNPMFVGNNNPGMDMRAMNSTPLPGGGGGGGGMNMGGMMSNGITPQQRQLMLMQQQRGGGGGGGPGNMNMSPQQQMMLQHQQQEQRMRMEQQQRMGMAAQQGGSPTHPGSPMMGGGDFPALRSNASIPGIARIARSPSDGGGGMTPRMTPTRGPSMGAEDFQRAMMQQQRGGMAGPGGGGFGPGGFPQQPSQGWNQNALQQQAMMGGGGGGGGGGYGMGMGMGGGGGPRPGSAYGGAPSPPGSGGGMGGGQNWGQGPGPGAYFAGSPGGGDLGMQRHMSGTPGPQMQQNATPDADFDAFNWG